MVRDSRFAEHIHFVPLYAALIVISLRIQEGDENAANILRTNLIWTSLMAVNVIWLACHYSLLPAGICFLIEALWLCKAYFLIFYNMARINGAYAMPPTSKVYLILTPQLVMVCIHFVLTVAEVKRLYRE